MSALFESARLSFREMDEADTPFMLELLSSRGFIEGIADRGVRTLDQARAYIVEKILPPYRDHGFGMWAVTPKGEAEPVGLAGLVKRDTLPRVDVGYAFLERAWGRGYATEAAEAVLRHAQEALGLTEIAAITNPDNHASQNVLRKVGLRFVDMRELPGGTGPSAYFETP